MEYYWDKINILEYDWEKINIWNSTEIKPIYCNNNGCLRLIIQKFWMTNMNDLEWDRINKCKCLVPALLVISCYVSVNRLLIVSNHKQSHAIIQIQCNNAQ